MMKIYATRLSTTHEIVLDQSKKIDKKKQKKNQQGFTLIELMVVVVILAILASFVVPNLLDNPDRARIVKAKQDIQAIEIALDLYKLDNFKYPNSLEELVNKPSSDVNNWRSGGYIKRLPKDPWGNEYQYDSSGSKAAVEIYTLGADGQSGGEGAAKDIGNWDE